MYLTSSARRNIFSGEVQTYNDKINETLNKLLALL